jgi:Flp pilus assembly pilin Flp
MIWAYLAGLIAVLLVLTALKVFNWILKKQ